MNAPKYETIEATARESALYQAGETIGAARGTEAAATMLSDILTKLQAQPSDVEQWLAAAADEVAALASLGPKATNYKARVVALGEGLRGMAKAVAERRKLNEGWLSECVGSAQQQAGKHREAFAQQLANIPAGNAGSAAGGVRKLAAWALQGAATALAGGKPR
jgi:hypothetical protein